MNLNKKNEKLDIENDKLKKEKSEIEELKKENNILKQKHIFKAIILRNLETKVGELQLIIDLNQKSELFKLKDRKAVDNGGGDEKVCCLDNFS